MAKHVAGETIADLLLKRKLLSKEALSSAEEEARITGTRLEKFLVERKLVQEKDICTVVSDYLKISPISLAHFTPGPDIVDLVQKKLSRELLMQRLIVPVSRIGNILTIAMADPFDIVAMDEISTLTGMDVIPLVASEEEVSKVLSRITSETAPSVDMNEILKEIDSDAEVTHEKVSDEGEETIDNLVEKAEGAPVVRMVSMMLLEAMRQNASDIHLEPQEKTLRLRYRIDGELMEMPSPPKNLQPAIISRIKIMSGMDIAERRVPQDGRIKIIALGKQVDLRVNTLPTIFGEKIVMRILDKSALFPNLDTLGLDEYALKSMKLGIAQPNGIILVTGPTGSGKTTTLYSCLMELNRPDVNIMTCEDPVEYQLPGINQVQINSYIGFTFAVALRSVLRQSPDIILVGEIRDTETAEIAIKAALTGHLVMSTLHTNDSSGAITRLIDMGIEPSLIASSLILAQAQRLLKKLCPACKKESHELPVDKLRSYGINPEIFNGVTVYEPQGCPKCRNTGYKGRMAIMEILPVDKELRLDILKGLSAKEIAARAVTKGMLTLKDIGMLKVKHGLTSIEAALSITGGGE